MSSKFLILALVLLAVANAVDAKALADDACGPGCFKAGSRLSDGNGRRALGDTSDESDGLRVRHTASLIILDHTPFSVVKCPSASTNSMLTLRSEVPTDQGMFLGQPFIAGGSQFDCKGTDDTFSPFYLRAIGTPIFSADGTSVSIDVRVAGMTEMIWGRARLETGISEADSTEGPLRRGPLRRTDLPDSFPQSSRRNLPTTLAEPVAPPAGCVYSLDCLSLIGLLATDECPKMESDEGYTGYPWSNPLSLDSAWYDQALYRAPSYSDIQYHVSESSNTGAWMVCPEGQYRYHCCDDTHANKLTYNYTDDVTEPFNYNYNTVTKQPETTWTSPDGSIMATSAAHLSLKVVINVDLTASHYEHALTGFLDHANIPSGIQKIDAYVEGDADMIAKATIKSGSFSATLGPYTLMERKKVHEKTYFVGKFPVHVRIDFGMQAVLDVSATYNFPSDIKLFAQAKGNIKYGAVYENGTFTDNNNDWLTLSYESETPDLNSAFKDSTVTGDIRLTIVPTVYATVYYLIPLEFQFNVYAGLNFIKYPEIAAADPTRLCSGLGVDLYYQTYYGVEAELRVRQVIIPEAWNFCKPTFSDGYDNLLCPCSAENPCFSGLPLVCLTEDDEYYGGLLEGETELATDQCACAGQSTDYCECLQFDEAQIEAERMYSANATVVYWAKYPKAGMLQIVPKTDVSESFCSACSGCLSGSVAKEATFIRRSEATPPTPPSDVCPTDDGMSTVIIIAVVAGVVVCLSCCIGVAVWYFCCRGEKSTSADPEDPDATPGVDPTTPNPAAHNPEPEKSEDIEMKAEAV